jgi:hypothetical protein
MKNIQFPKELVVSNDLLGRLMEFWGGDFLETLARETKFIQRTTSTITGKMFFGTNVFQEGSLQEISLNNQCDFFSEEHNVTIKKQSLDERYNTYAVAFMKRCFGHVINEVLVKQNFTGLSTKFKRIRITDATSFQLPANLAAFYVGNGGDTSESTIKIHYEYDVLTGNFMDIQIGCGRKNDADFLKSIKNSFQKGDLLIKDLGYYQHLYFKEVHEAGAFFIARYKSKTNLYSKDKNGKWISVDTAAIFKSTKELKDATFYLGQQKIPIRLIVQPISSEDAKKRLAGLKKEAKHKDWNQSETRELLCSFNVFITNIDDSINAESIIELYTLRWQIELVFKIWKSLFQIEQVSRTNIFRFECYLFGKLIAICLSQNIQSLFKEYLWENGFEMSEWKGFKILKKNAAC